MKRAKRNTATLDGQPAYVSQRTDGFFVVRLQSGKGGDVEFSEQAVLRIMESGGNFKS